MTGVLGPALLLGEEMEDVARPGGEVGEVSGEVAMDDEGISCTASALASSPKRLPRPDALSKSTHPERWYPVAQMIASNDSSLTVREMVCWMTSDRGAEGGVLRERM